MSIRHRLCRQINALFRKRGLDAEMDEEMRAHVELRTQANREAGMPPTEARTAALRHFGWVESIKFTCREARGVNWIEHLVQDTQFAARGLRNNPGFTAVAVLTLALGLGLNTALFSLVYGVLLRPLPFPEQDRLVTLWESDPGKGIDQQNVSPPNLLDWQSRNRSLADISFWTGPSDFNWLAENSTEKVRTTFASSSLFQALRIKPMLGRGFLPEDDRPNGPQVAVISSKLWHDRFDSDPAAPGQSLTVDSWGRRTYTVVGVMPPGFQFPEDTDLWLAAGWNGLPQNRRNGHWLNVLARLKPGLSLNQARAEMNAIQAQISRDNYDAQANSGVSVIPLLRQLVGSKLRTALFVLWGVVGSILLIAATNVANLLLARATTRQKEIALRMALGAGRWRIIRQLLTESLLLASLGGAVGTLLGYWGLKVLIAASPSNIPRLENVSLDGTVLGFTFLAALGTGIIFGLAPAWQFTRPEVNESLKTGGHSSTGGADSRNIRGFLLAGQVALATVLLVGAGLTLRSFANLVTTDWGFQTDHIITAELDFSVSGFTTWVHPTGTRPQVRLRALLEHLRQLPGVQFVGASSGFLRQDNRPPSQSFTVFEHPDVDPNSLPAADHKAVSPDFIHGLGIQLQRGRDFTEADQLEAPGVAIVNESFARRYFPDENPLGKHITPGHATGPLTTNDVYGIPVWSEIVGVVRDTKSLTTQPEAVPEVYRPYWQWPMQSPTVFVRTSGDPRSLTEAIRRETKLTIPNIPPPKIRFFDSRLQESIAQPKFQASLLNLFGAVALLLAGCGIYGVLAYNVTQRRREFAIRTALGAQRRKVFGSVISQGLRMTAIGAVAGTIGALGLTKLLRNLLYEVGPADPLTFAAVVFLLLVVALAACWLPARRASRIDPLAALRND